MPSLRNMGGNKSSRSSSSGGRSSLWGGSLSGEHNESKAYHTESKVGVSSKSSSNGGRASSWGISLNRNYNESKVVGGSKAQGVVGGSMKAPWGGSVSRKQSVMGNNKGKSGNYKQGGVHERVSQWMQQVSALQKQEMEEAFNFFDDDKDGKITATELASALRRLGESPTDEEVREMMKEADSNGDGVISFEEFLTLQSGVGNIHRQDSIFRQDVRQAFSKFDADGNGLISPEELQGVLGRLGRPSSLADCRLMISRVDLDGDGHINFEEFLCMMRE